MAGMFGWSSGCARTTGRTGGLLISSWPIAFSVRNAFTALLILTAMALVALAEVSAESSSALHLSLGVILIVVLVLLATSDRRSTADSGQHSGLPVDDPADIDLLMPLLREKEAAESANIAKSRYLAHVSHEMRAPLNSIYGYAQLVERNDAIDPADAAKVIRRSAEHLTNLVEGLLDLSAVETGVLRVASDTVRFGPFLEQIASMFRPAALAKGLTFQCDLPDRLPEHVRLDQKRVRQILINLLSNAIKFTASGGIVFRVRYAAPIAVFEVIDTGPGVSEADRERIFAAFDRGSNQDSLAQPGAGLGLSITEALVRILGGELQLESEPGSGSCFRLTLMLGQASGQMLDTGPVRRVVGYEGDRVAILVADDDIQQLALMRHLLEALGFEVAVAPNGETAVTLCRTRHFPLAILDISMPGMSGWETAAALRAEHGGVLRILMLSGNAHELNAPSNRPPVHDHFLVKPFDIDMVIDVIGQQLGIRWIWSVAGEEPSASPAAPTPDRVPAAAMAHVERLRDLIRIGHVRGIEAEIALFAEAAPDRRDLADLFYAHLDRFDLPGLAQQLDRIEDGQPVEP